MANLDELTYRIYALEQEMKIFKNIVAGCVAAGSFLYTYHTLSDVWKTSDAIAGIFAFLVAIIAVAYSGWQFGRAARRPSIRVTHEEGKPSDKYEEQRPARLL